MNRDFPFDYSLLIPLLVGIVSVLGIFFVFVPVRLFRGSDVTVVLTSTATPFKYLLLATETAIPASELETAAADATKRILPTPTPIPQGSVTSFPALTEQILTSAGDVFMPTLTATSNPVLNRTAPMTIGTYDDSDPLMIRSGDWVSQENAGVAYQGTLLVSNTVGNYISFRFDGQQMIVGYHSDVGLGTVKVTIDGVEFLLSQSNEESLGNEWISEQIPQGTHLVIITHESGASVNLDYIEIPD